jgi:hypothetical protein
VIGRTLQQIEVTTRCQLHCTYCLQPRLTRPRQDISAADWTAALGWVEHFVKRGTQGELVLFGTGEPFLHPAFVEMATAARKVIGPDRRLLTTTNGLCVTADLVRRLQPLNVRVYVSLHRPELAASAVFGFQEAGLLEGVSTDPVTGSNDWAGQVPWPNRLPRGEDRPACPWQQLGWIFVGSDGVIYPCCYANGDAPKLARVTDGPHEVTMRDYAICERCWQRTPKPGEDAVRIIR